MNLRPCGYEPHELTRLLHPAVQFIIVAAYCGFFKSYGSNLRVYNKFMNKSWKTSSKIIGWVLAACSALGLVASFTLLHETFELAKNPNYVPSCNLSVFISCQGAMASDSSALFLGIPNPAMGIAAFTALFVFAVLLLSGAKFKPWVWLAGIGAASAGLLVTLFFYFESVLKLGTICPWCAVTWVATVAVFWTVITHVFAAKHVTLSKKLQGVSTFWLRYDSVILVSTYALLVVGILYRFREILFV